MWKLGGKFDRQVEELAQSRPGWVRVPDREAEVEDLRRLEPLAPRGTVTRVLAGPMPALGGEASARVFEVLNRSGGRTSTTYAAICAAVRIPGARLPWFDASVPPRPKDSALPPWWEQEGFAAAADRAELTVRRVMSPDTARFLLTPEVLDRLRRHRLYLNVDGPLAFGHTFTDYRTPEEFAQLADTVAEIVRLMPEELRREAAGRYAEGG